MTRAADRLVVCGAVGEKSMPSGCWYQLIAEGLDATGELIEAPADFGDGTVKRYRKGALDAADAPAAARTQGEFALLPGWLTTKVEAAPARAQPIKPSGFSDDPATAGAAAARLKAIRRGNVVHRLMQSLPDIPPDHRAEAARRYLARQSKDFDAAERDAIEARVLALLGDARFAALFAPGSRAEVPIVGRLGSRTVSGTVDRLVVTPEAIEIADYKTNRPAPASLAETQARHPGYVAQLALYRAVLMRLYPGRPIRAALLWTDTPGLQEIPAEALDAAAAEVTAA
jgi:ATP-dependent helicase/nuclease subunit A